MKKNQTSLWTLVPCIPTTTGEIFVLRKKMKISKEHLNKIITEEVQRALSEITDDELERLLAMGREKQSPKEKITQVIGDNPEEATDAMFNILGADGIKDIMIALAHASGDEELLNYTKTMNENKE